MKMVVAVKSKLRLALGSVKDHASIGKAMVSGCDVLSNIEIAIVRATCHDETPINEKYVHEILFLVSNSPGSITFLTERILRRLDKTQDHVVALKTLILIHRLIRGGDRNFEQDLRNSRLSSELRMNLRRLTRNTDHLIAFIHDYAAFLEERMRWIINQAGKLEPVLCQSTEFQFYEDQSIELALRKLPRCQTFLDRIMDCLPIEFSHSELILVALGNILRESFQVYASFYEGVATLVDSFLSCKKPARVLALNIIKRASCQSYELFEYFENCKRLVGDKNFDYPSVRIITTAHVSTMEQFLTFGDGSLLIKNGSPLSPISNLTKPIETRTKEGNGGGEVTKRTDGASITLFSCKLETKISMVWVEFTEEDTESSSFSINGSDSCFSGNIGDLLLDGRARNVEIEKGKPWSCYNPFMASMDTNNGNFIRG